MQSEHKPNSSGHETTDADVRPILRFLFGLFALIALVLVGMTFFFDFLHDRYEQAATKVSPLVDTVQVPPEPKLQVNPAEERKEVRNWEDQRLHSYEWIDKNTGTFRIPIERAMELVAKRGLPARQSPNASASAKTGGSH
jgi:hypothetical protein